MLKGWSCTGHGMWRVPGEVFVRKIQRFVQINREGMSTLVPNQRIEVGIVLILVFICS